MGWGAEIHLYYDPFNLICWGFKRSPEFLTFLSFSFLVYFNQIHFLLKFSLKKKKKVLNISKILNMKHSGHRVGRKIT